MTGEQLNTLAEYLHQTTIDNGWTEIKRSQDDLLLLILSEANEAFEAWRKNKYCSDLQIDSLATREFIEYFNQEVKDTFQDELADTAIRVLDTAAYLGLQLSAPVFVGTAKKGDFNLDLKTFTKMVVGLFDRPLRADQLSYIFNLIYSIALQNDIDLFNHIASKNTYNQLRGIRHGNKLI